MVSDPNYSENIERLFAKLPLCPKCKIELGRRVRRGIVLKKFFSWLPVKRYFCYKCQKKHYIWG